MTKLGYVRIGECCGESSTAYLVPQGHGIVWWVRRRFGQAVSRQGPVEYTVASQDRDVVRNPGRPLADRLRVLDTLLARFVAAT